MDPCFHLQYVTVSLALVEACGDFTAMVFMKKIFAEFELAPFDSAWRNVVVTGAGQLLKKLLVQIFRSHI